MKKVNQGIILAGSLVGSLALSAVAMAEPFDGGKIMLCANQSASECVAGADCVNVSPGSVNLPNFFQINTGEKLISAVPGSGLTSTTTIERVEHLDGKLMLQGADDGIKDVRDGAGWTMSINEATGQMVMTTAGDGFAVVVFGACTLR
jgi:hypothetical protein